MKKAIIITLLLATITARAGIPINDYFSKKKNRRQSKFIAASQAFLTEVDRTTKNWNRLTSTVKDIEIQVMRDYYVISDIVTSKQSLWNALLQTRLGIKRIHLRNARIVDRFSTWKEKQALKDVTEHYSDRLTTHSDLVMQLGVKNFNGGRFNAEASDRQVRMTAAERMKMIDQLEKQISLSKEDYATALNLINTMVHQRHANFENKQILLGFLQPNH